jgi:hypothetical protein
VPVLVSQLLGNNVSFWYENCDRGQEATALTPLEEAALRLFEHLQDRPDGPMSFRIALQPLMASILAVRDGIKDGRAGKPPYLVALLGPNHGRRAALIDGIRATLKIVLVAMLLDMIYQVLVYQTVYPGEAVIVAVILGFLPYSLLRGPVGRIAKSRQSPMDGRGKDG